MSQMVDEILNYDINEYKSKLKARNRDERFKLACLVTLYSNNAKLDSLKNFIMVALHEDFLGFLYNSDIDCQIHDPVRYTHIRNKLNDFYIYYDDQRAKIANYLYCIEEKTNLPLKFLDGIAKTTQIKILSDFFKKILNKKVVIVVDSLDESLYLFNFTNTKNIHKANLNNLQPIVDSIMDCLKLALGDQNDAAFDIIIFLPKIQNLKIIWGRRDKIPIIELNWNPRILKSFADFTMNHLKNQQQSESCKRLPTFMELFDNDSKMVEQVLSSLRHPRDFYIFMDSLLQILNENAIPENPKPFVVTKQNKEEALNRFEERKLGKVELADSSNKDEKLTGKLKTEL